MNKKIAIIEDEQNKYNGNPKETDITNLVDWYIFDKNTNIEKEIKDLDEHYAIILKVINGTDVGAVCCLDGENYLEEKNGRTESANDR